VQAHVPRLSVPGRSWAERLDGGSFHGCGSGGSGRFQPFGPQPAAQERFGDLPELRVPRAGLRLGRAWDGARRTHRTPSAALLDPLPIGMPEPRQLVDNLVERLALDELHGVEGDAALLPDLENRHDVGVVQSRRSLRLATETLESPAVAHHVAGQNL